MPVPSQGHYGFHTMCCFSVKHAALRRKSKDRLARNRDNMSELDDMSIRRMLFRWDSPIKIQLSVLVWYKATLIIISLKINLFSPWYSWKITELALSKYYSFTNCVYVFTTNYTFIVLFHILSPFNVRWKSVILL
jgi:hypothetical protein